MFVFYPHMEYSAAGGKKRADSIPMATKFTTVERRYGPDTRGLGGGAWGRGGGRDQKVMHQIDAKLHQNDGTSRCRKSNESKVLAGEFI